MSTLFILCVVLNATAAVVNLAAGNTLAGCLFVAATVVWILTGVTA